jgi:geranylgeranyl pyrophosphate synthase
MYLQEIKDYLLSKKQVQSFPQIADSINRQKEKKKMAVWDYAFRACEAVGGKPLAALPVSAACYCLLASIHLVDDMLDNDPRGDYHVLGTGTCANLALAFGAIGIGIANNEDVPAALRPQLVNELTGMMLSTAHAQQMDISQNGDETLYWEITKSKSPPLFGSALFGGCLLGNGNVQQAKQIKELALPFGLMVQISDDIYDVMQPTVSADWFSKNNNLAILYAMKANHKDRLEFLDQLQQVSPQNLDRLRSIVISSGALSYCLYHLLEQYKIALDLVKLPGVEKPRKLKEIANYLVAPAINILELHGFNMAGFKASLEKKKRQR